MNLFVKIIFYLNICWFYKKNNRNDDRFLMMKGYYSVYVRFDKSFANRT